MNAQTSDPESFRWSLFGEQGELLEEGFDGDPSATVHLYRYDNLGNWTSHTINDYNTIDVRRYHAYQLDACSNWTTRTVYEPPANNHTANHTASEVVVSYRDLRTIRYHRDCRQP